MGIPKNSLVFADLKNAPKSRSNKEKRRRKNVNFLGTKVIKHSGIDIKMFFVLHRTCLFFKQKHAISYFRKGPVPSMVPT